MNTGNLNIATRFGLTSALFFSLFAVCTWLGMSGSGFLSDATKYIINNKYQKVVLAYEMIDVVNRNASGMGNILLLENQSDVDRERRAIIESQEENSKNYSRLEASVSSERGKELLRNVLEARNQYGASQNDFMGLAASGKRQEAKELFLTKLRQDQRSYFDALRGLIRHQTESVIETGNRAEETYQTTRTKLLGLAALASIVGIGLSFWLGRSLIIPLREAIKVARTVSSGDLSSKIEVKTKDETGLLLLSLKQMNDSLVRVVSEVRSGADSIATSTSQIAVGNQDLSARTEQQAASLEQTAASMTELTETVRQNAENARQASSLAVKAREVASTGGQEVAAMVEAMNEINSDSAKIAEITGMIEGIAFQTNILALNAAVEAARAGEQGRGFAVVAGEVRSLAQRASAAAKEIKELIGASARTMNDGAHRVSSVSTAFSQLDKAITQVSDVIEEISAASEEQSRGIEQVHQAISQIDEVTQQNAALVEESAAAAQSMQEQAGKMKQEVTFFKLEDESTGSARPSVVQSAAPTRLASGATVPGKSRESSGSSTARIVANSNRASASAGTGDWHSF